MLKERPRENMKHLSFYFEVGIVCDRELAGKKVISTFLQRRDSFRASTDHCFDNFGVHRKMIMD